MNADTIILTEDDNIFDYLGGEFTTVTTMLEIIATGVDEMNIDPSTENKETVLSLDKTHYYNDDLFNLYLNKAVTNQDILRDYNIKIYRIEPEKKFIEPDYLHDLSIMGVFKYDTKEVA